MIRFTLTALLVLLPGSAGASASYRIEKAGNTLVATRNRDGKPALYVTVKFRIIRADGQAAEDVEKEQILVEEDGQRVTELEIHRPDSLDPLTAFLTLDVSGSMAERGKMDQAKHAAKLFLDRLNSRTDCGLLFFDHELSTPVPPAGERGRIPTHRQMLRQRIEAVRPAGGTAYLDATALAIDQVARAKGRRAVVVMTDGVDLNSRHTLKEVIKKAQLAEVPVYTVGVGEVGRNDPVSTVLVLDCSVSMRDPSSPMDRTSKFDAMKQAAARFVDLMRPGSRATLLPFSTVPAVPEPFSDDKLTLVRSINRLRVSGGTALYDAGANALDTLAAAQLLGKQAVILLTDGRDGNSRRGANNVIDRAREIGIPVHVLAFGSEREINEPILRQIAAGTGGSYHHAQTAADLTRIFEALAIQLHDDGIDEDTLREMADKTGGKFFHAREAVELARFYGDLAEELQTTYTVTFPSRRPTHDGTSRGIDISVLRGGVRVSDVASFDYNVHGVVVPEMDHRVYLALLAGIGFLLGVPVWICRVHQAVAGTHPQSS